MKIFLTLLILISALSAKAQVNGYARVAFVGGPALTLSVSNETYDQFDAGDKVLVMQMQDNVIGSNTSNNNALPWNGDIGGVVAFSVNGILTLNHSITANNAGFRGGVADVSTNLYASCNSRRYFNAVHAFYGNKGEGIYKVTNTDYAAGMGKILTGGSGAKIV